MSVLTPANPPNVPQSVPEHGFRDVRRWRAPLAAAVAIAAVVVAAAVVAAPASARADGFACSASAVRGAVLGQATEPVRAGSPAACPADSGALAPLEHPLGGDGASARTGMAGEQATATSSVSGLRAGSLAALAPELPRVALPAGIGALSVPLPPAAQLLGLPAVVTVDATRAAQALVPDRTLAAVPLVAAGTVHLGVGAACRAGRAVLDSVAVVERLAALGQDLPTDRPLDTAVPLTPAQVVDFSRLDADAVDLPGGLSLDDPVTGPLLRQALEAAIAGLPAASVPAAVGRVVVEPAAREDGGDALRQLGPRIRVEALGREVADLRLGDVLVSAAGVVCAPPAGPPAPQPQPDLSPATELALRCAPSDVVLTDVVEKDGQVKLVGIAGAQYVGRTVDLVLTHTGERVATAVVEPDGWFRARAPLPPNRIRWTNDARYQASIDSERSLALKLHRRMRLSRLKPGEDTVTIAGRIYGPMAGARVVISRREACTQDVRLATVKPDPDGRWRVTLPKPQGVPAATYRATTLVRRPGGVNRFRTFTLPGHVAL
ncbi:MAG TPA: hypothetical protein VM266_16690 [Solirubrobacteraceae bacterium]|nr:hypothetical protein [Solirubrobacteraceae bacterium]